LLQAENGGTPGFFCAGSEKPRWAELAPKTIAMQAAAIPTINLSFDVPAMIFPSQFRSLEQLHSHHRTRKRIAKPKACRFEGGCARQSRRPAHYKPLQGALRVKIWARKPICELPTRTNVCSTSTTSYISVLSTDLRLETSVPTVFERVIE
jgi:hypothetical protein